VCAWAVSHQVTASIRLGLKDLRFRVKGFEV
jgi:hypothetical protein